MRGGLADRVGLGDRCCGGLDGDKGLGLCLSLSLSLSLGLRYGALGACGATANCCWSQSNLGCDAT